MGLLLLLPACDAKNDQPSPSAPPTLVADTTPILNPDKPEQIFTAVCTACHGPNGEGNRELNAPSIAALPTYYSTNQLRKFQNDIRGAEPGDDTGAQMRAIAHSLPADAIDPLADHIAALPRVPTQNTLGGNPEPGKNYFEWYCAECHRINGSGELFFGSPPLIGLPDWYLAAQIKKFQSGLRGVHPDDVNGKKMLIPSERLLTEQEIKDLLAYIAVLAEKYQPKPKR
ncbi:MAG: c-type cytochrome [Verrucomicrobiota bacterium]